MLKNLTKGAQYAIMQNPDEWDNHYIIQIARPHLIGYPVRIPQNKPEAVEKMMKELAEGRIAAKVKGYSIFIVPRGTFTGEDCPDDKALEAVRGMADFYLTSQVLRHKYPNKEYLEGYVDGTYEAIGRRIKERKERERGKGE